MGAIMRRLRSPLTKVVTCVVTAVVIGGLAYLIGHVAGRHPQALGIVAMAAVFLVADVRRRWRSSRKVQGTRLYDHQEEVVIQALPVPTPEVAALVERGRKIKAIARYRELNPGIGIRQAKEFIDRL